MSARVLGDLKKTKNKPNKLDSISNYWVYTISLISIINDKHHSPTKNIQNINHYR